MRAQAGTHARTLVACAPIGWPSLHCSCCRRRRPRKSEPAFAKSLACRSRPDARRPQRFGIASRLSRAKIKCSICSSQFNTWDAQHRWALVLIVCLNRGRRFKARFVAPTGCPGIAVPPGSAHARPWRVFFCSKQSSHKLK